MRFLFPPALICACCHLRICCVLTHALTLRHALLADFITEAKEGAAQVVAAEGLGMGPHVPRVLRRRAGQMVTGLPSLTVEQTETLVHDIWRVRAWGI